jgi:hypothetical protein
VPAKLSQVKAKSCGDILTVHIRGCRRIATVP